MIRLALAAGLLMAFVQVEPFNSNGSVFVSNGDTEAAARSAMRILHNNATSSCGMRSPSGANGYTTQGLQCRSLPSRVGGASTMLCTASITCTNRPGSGPPPVPSQARPQ